MVHAAHARWSPFLTSVSNGHGPTSDGVMSIRTLIVDDERLARSGIRLKLARHPDVEIVAETGDPFLAVELVHDLDPDLLFLDIQMPGMDGFGVLEALGDALPEVVFVTAYDAHAIQAFRVNAVDYLLKPVDDAAFDEALGRARRRLAAGTHANDATLNALRELLEGYRSVAPAAAERYMERILVRNGERASFIDVETVDYISAEDNYVRIHAGAKSHLVRGRMVELERRLDPARFVRIHRRTIVRHDRIRDVRIDENGRHMITLVDGTQLRLSRSYRDALLGQEL